MRARSMPEAVSAAKAPMSGLLRRARHLGDDDLAAFDRHQVGEGAADLDAYAHERNPIMGPMLVSLPRLYQPYRPSRRRG